MFTDSHCHLFSEYYDNIDEILINAQNYDVRRFIVSADNINSCKYCVDLAKKNPNIYITIGIHPQNCYENYDELEKLLIDNLNNSKLVAIGEIGLDYYYGKNDKVQQLNIFEKQLKLAEKCNLPVVIHSREATLDTIECLKKYKVRGVIHCFSGSYETAMQYIKMGFYIGVGGVMTFKNSKIDEVIKKIPLDKIVLETDSPYLTPEPFRKYSNEPKYIRTIAEYLAKLKDTDLSVVSKITEKNIKEVFDI